MNDVLLRLGLSEKEAQFYVKLLETKPLTAAQVAKLLQEKRANTYVILDNLAELGLISYDDSQPVRRYLVQAPEKLHELLEQKEQQLKSTRSSLQSVVDELKSAYRLGQHKPGVSYLEGIDGYKKMLEGCARSSEEVLIFGSVDNPSDSKYQDILVKGLMKRKALGVHSRMLFHEDAKHWENLERFARRGQEIRFWGSKPFHGEIVIYEDKLILTVYEPEIINVILNNSVIADTFKIIFNQIWDTAAALPEC